MILLEGEEASSMSNFEVDGTSYHPEGKVHGIERTRQNGKMPINLKRFC